MMNALARDLQKLKSRAYHMADGVEDTLRRFHSVLSENKTNADLVRPLYEWMLVPPTLWPFHVQDALENCLATIEKGKRLTSQQRLLLELLPPPPNEQICDAVAGHERNVEKGSYENLLKTQAKYSQNEIAIRADGDLRRQWKQIKTHFDVAGFQDHKGVIRRTMSTERNLRPNFCANLNCKADAFQAVFDAFCLRWNLYGMQHDQPLLLKLAVNITPFGTLIHIPSYWSFDPKRDICWDAIAKLHRVRVPGRQGAVLAEGLVQRMKDAKKLHRLDKQAVRLGLRGDAKHEFLCAGLGWDARTSPKRLARLRVEFSLR